MVKKTLLIGTKDLISSELIIMFQKEFLNEYKEFNEILKD